jgi:phenylacetate-CoA ligase
MTVKKPLPGDLEPIETASRDEISVLQLARLKWSLRHTWDNVAAYREKCAASGVHPDDLKTLADLARFPFMTKADLRDHYPFGLFAVPRNQLRRLHASSGTTGNRSSSATRRTTSTTGPT